MSGERSSVGVRERVWITKWDHTVDPPCQIEEVLIENGVIQAVTLGHDARTEDQARDSRSPRED